MRVRERASALALTVVLAACGGASDRPQAGSGAAYAQDADPTPGAPKSVILFIGDGMGPQQMALLMDWADAADAGPTHIQSMANEGTLGMLRVGAYVSPCPDSAATATALACGITTRSGVIAVDPKGQAVRTCLEDARDAGRLTGLVTSTRLTHATPACFAAHVPNRGMEKQIAAQLVNESGVDVMLGGGARFFPATLREAAEDKGYRLLGTRQELEILPADAGKVLGIFSNSHIPYALDRDGEGERDAPSLAQMTSKAIGILAQGKKGFFLMVEGGRIDHAGHGNDVAGVLGEMREFDDAVGVALEFAKSHPELLVVVTADHETGGLAVSHGAGSPLLPQHLLAMAEVKETIGAQLSRAKTRKTVTADDMGIGRHGFYPPSTRWPCAEAIERSAKFGVSYGTQGHTTTPVAVIARGPGHERFGGLRHNSHVGKLLRGWMQK